MKVSKLRHNGSYYYAIKINSNDARVLKVKNFENSKWSDIHQSWLLPVSKQSEDFILSIHVANQKKKRSGGEVHLLVLKGNRLRIPCHPTEEGISFIKSLTYYFYDPKTKYWTIAFTDSNFAKIKWILEKKYDSVVLLDQRKRKSKPKKEIPTEFKKTCPSEMRDKLIELRYSSSTIKSYTNLFSTFLSHFYMFDAKEITYAQIIKYMRFLVQEREVSESYQNQMINAIKFYYEKVLKSDKQTYFVERPRRSKNLPTVLSQQETIGLLKYIPNVKHKTIVTLIYSCGLRISELLHLKIVDLDYDAMRVCIKNAKGKKDRYVPLAERTVDMLRYYLKHYVPEDYVFEGLKGGRYSPSSVQKFLKKYCEELGIKKKVSPHTLRHSYATHLLENGVDIRYIQHILGHASSKTTEIYTHITEVGINKIKNPLDLFDMNS